MSNPLPATSGIYAITHIASRKLYIGSSINMRRRMICHLSALRNGRHSNEHLQRAFDKHGFESFAISALETCVESELVNREQHHIDARRSHLREFGYNLCPSAAFKEASPETRAKLRAAALGMKRGPMSDEHKAKLSAAHKGKKMLPHVKENLARIARSRIRTPAERAKISAANTGKRRSDEARAKMSAAHRRRRISKALL